MGAPLSLRLLRLYPKMAGSRLVGKLVKLRIAPRLRRRVLGGFAAFTGADLSEADRDLPEYETVLDFFTRRLKAGLRVQAPLVPGGVNSPVDGALIALGRVEEGTLLQAKGLPYRLDELLAHHPFAAELAGGAYLTLYLAPRDYHRIHVPVEGECIAIGRVEGELWPVNEASTAHTGRLYVRNRRAFWLARGTGADAGLVVAVVMVAATHVGGVPLHERWTGGRALDGIEARDVANVPATPGDDLGAFELGSTVVLIVGGSRSRQWKAERGLGPVKVGERLGAF